MNNLNGNLKQLEADVENIKDTLTLLCENIGKLAGPLEHVSNALTVVSQRLDFLCNNITHMVSIWEKSIPVKLMVLIVLLIALAFGGHEVISLLAKAFL